MPWELRSKYSAIGQFDGIPFRFAAAVAVRESSWGEILDCLSAKTRDTVAMRPTDRARLSEPYPENTDPPDAAAMAALGKELPQWAALETEILADFTEQPPWGIGWWAPDPGTSRRILIADQLHCYATSVAGNMTEAALHWLEFLDASDRDSARFVDAVKMENGRPTIEAPRARSPLEQLGPEFVRIHQAGIIRALASALDCLAGVIIGVAALPTSILQADFDRARTRLGKITGAANDGEKMQAHFSARLEASIVASGPPGWLDWTLDFRNMLVHRGRRFEYGQFVPRTPALFGADGRPVLRARRVTHLPRDPGRSDVEVFLDTPWTMVVGEERERTLQGLIGSTKSLLETTAKALLELWQWRRDHAASLRQPVAQWPNGRSTQSTGFNGYAPRTLELAPGMAMVHPVAARRFRSAALDDPARPQWATFD
jgi:hypothetical protein